jgi:hypothetical protein
MEVKLFEIRDRGTFIPAIAVRLCTDNETERWLLGRSGYRGVNIDPAEKNVEPYVILSKLDGVEAQYDPFRWPNRTMARAHLHINSKWFELVSGDIIDVEFIHGESQVMKTSERFD